MANYEVQLKCVLDRITNVNAYIYTVYSCQKKCCISNALDGSEVVTVWVDDEDKDDSDRVESTDNDSVMSDDSEYDK
jgi:flavoprotein